MWLIFSGDVFKKENLKLSGSFGEKLFFPKAVLKHKPNVVN